MNNQNQGVVYDRITGKDIIIIMMILAVMG